MLVKSHRLSVNFPLPSSMRIGNSEVLFVSSVKNLGVTLDCNLNMTQHVLNIRRSAYSELRQLVPYAIYSLLKRLNLSSVLSFCPAWTTATAYSLAVTVSH